MKKVASILLSLLLVSCAGVAFAVESEEVDCDVSNVERGMTDQELEDFNEAAEAYMRKRYEELGYTEVKTPATLEQICEEVDVSSDIRALASMDIETAPVEMREDILAARREIIFRADGWYADEAGIYLVWFDDAKKEWGELPRFSELFPGWDLPTADSTDVAATEDVESTKAVAE